ncbi:SDR family NAD(P)-dependent oxidoreductase [Prevotella sp. E13-17]|uniref:SDR family NAD(P)-dependent oxidoreductase n=1 Tax=Prevotella sp. E13-17 TaxID=2913616 RepID=UPI001EDBFCF1|nr:SDR family NAD(P)-dependent oxidoreductase [Prevotella sp. E13-17]UKK50094.1 SDR family NAD(P)-dependent oxidoreductase [Prevotella sp. E13-17]
MKRAIVVGASSGIGMEVARLLRENGWTVGVAARRIEMLSEFDFNAKIDVNDDDSESKLLDLIDSVGGMDLYFHCSGIGHQNRQLEEEIEVQTVKTNCLGFTRMVGAAYRYFSSHGGGHIAVISSIAGTKGLGPAPSYSASKSFQGIYIQALEQLSNRNHLNIHFTDIRPGFVATALIDDGQSYPLVLDKHSVAEDIVRSVIKQRHRRVIDWRWRVITRLWRLVPNIIWRHLPL